MKLYKILAKEYNQIFPLSQEQVNLVESYLAQKHKPTILDIGCANGQLVLSLSKEGRSIIGFDLDQAMIEEAKATKPSNLSSNVEFYQADMLEFTKTQQANSTDLATCLGNTLTYLDGEDELKTLLQSVFTLLKDDGAFIIQILNYNNPKIKADFLFPILESDSLKFTREYIDIGKADKLGFSTTVENKKSGEVVKDLHELFLFDADRISDIAKDSGFNKVDLFGSFGKKERKQDDFYNVIVLHK